MKSLWIERIKANKNLFTPREYHFIRKNQKMATKIYFLGVIDSWNIRTEK